MWRRIQPSQIVCKYEPQKKVHAECRSWSQVRAVGGTYIFLLAGCLYAVIFMVGIFLPPLG